VFHWNVLRGSQWHRMIRSLSTEKKRRILVEKKQEEATTKMARLLWAGEPLFMSQQRLSDEYEEFGRRPRLDISLVIASLDQVDVFQLHSTGGWERRGQSLTNTTYHLFRSSIRDTRRSMATQLLFI
jgi:hypothetical protein